MKVFSIKKKKRDINNRVNNTLYATGKRQTLLESEFPRMEKSLYRWFLHMQNKKNGDKWTDVKSQRFRNSLSN